MGVLYQISMHFLHKNLEQFKVVNQATYQSEIRHSTNSQFWSPTLVYAIGPGILRYLVVSSCSVLTDCILTSHLKVTCNELEFVMVMIDI